MYNLFYNFTLTLQAAIDRLNETGGSGRDMYRQKFPWFDIVDSFMATSDAANPTFIKDSSGEDWGRDFEEVLCVPCYICQTLCRSI
jgi:hypothetical protein